MYYYLLLLLCVDAFVRPHSHKGISNGLTSSLPLTIHSSFLIIIWHCTVDRALISQHAMGIFFLLLSNANSRINWKMKKLKIIHDRKATPKLNLIRSGKKAMAAFTAPREIIMKLRCTAYAAYVCQMAKKQIIRSNASTHYGKLKCNK